MRKYVCLFLVWSLVQGLGSGVYSQFTKIGTSHAASGFVQGIVIKDTASFYTYSKSIAFLKEKWFLARYDHLEKIYQQEMKTKYDGKEHNLIRVERIKQQTIAFLATVSENRASFKTQSYDTFCLPVGGVKNLAEIPLENSACERMTLLFSKNRKFLLVGCYLLDKKIDSRRFSGAVLNEHLSVIKRFNMNGSAASGDCSFGKCWLSDEGAVMVSEQILFPKRAFESKFKRKMNFMRLHQFADSLRVFNMHTIFNEFISLTEVLQDRNGSISGIGIYCNEKDHARGFYSFSQTDSSSDELRIYPIDRDKIPGFSELRIDYSKKRKHQRQIKGYVCNEFRLLHFNQDSTNRKVFVWERTDHVYHKSGDIYWNLDLMVMNFEGGVLTNVTVVPRYCISYNDQGVNMSSFTTAQKEKIRIYFNDFVDYYDANGSFLNSGIKYTDRSGKMGIAEVSYDLKSNSLERKLLFDATYTELKGSPKYWEINPLNQTIVMSFMSVNNIQFGIWKY